MAHSLRRLVIKPTLACTASCAGCSLRLGLYTRRAGRPEVDLGRWRAVLRDAHALGCRDLHVSGGEPGLYAHLAEVVAEGADLDMRPNLNTNGSPIDNALAGRLAASGLESACVSVYSHRAEVHDTMRAEPGLFERSMSAIAALQRQPGVQVDLQTVLADQTLTELDGMLRLAYRTRVGYLYISYVEGDLDGRWRPSPARIARFRAQTRPRMHAEVQRSAPAAAREEARRAIDALFDGDVARRERFARGVYNPGGTRRCHRPYTFALILGTGEVHPCNGVEYCHDPLMGSVLEDDLPSLWRGERWVRFRRERMDWCERCPMIHHLRIPVLGEAAA